MTQATTQIQRGSATTKEWTFAEKHWYCHECGLVAQKDVRGDADDPDTGVCRLSLRNGNHPDELLTEPKNHQEKRKNEIS